MVKDFRYSSGLGATLGSTYLFNISSSLTPSIMYKMLIMYKTSAAIMYKKSMHYWMSPCCRCPGQLCRLTWCQLGWDGTRRMNWGVLVTASPERNSETLSCQIPNPSVHLPWMGPLAVSKVAAGFWPTNICVLQIGLQCYFEIVTWKFQLYLKIS